MHEIEREIEMVFDRSIHLEAVYMWLERIGIQTAGIEDAFKRGHHQSGEDVNKSFLAYGKNMINALMNHKLKRPHYYPSFILMVHHVINNNSGKKK